MVRLIDCLARERRFYPAPTLAAPGVMVIDVPPASRGPGLALGRYYPIVVETLAEREELEAYLHAERTADVVPDLFDMRGSALQSELVLVWRYEPPEPSWPWITRPIGLRNPGPSRVQHLKAGDFTVISLRRLDQCQVERDRGCDDHQRRVAHPNFLTRRRRHPERARL